MKKGRFITYIKEEEEEEEEQQQQQQYLWWPELRMHWQW